MGDGQIVQIFQLLICSTQANYLIGFKRFCSLNIAAITLKKRQTQLTRLYSHHFQDYEKPRKIREGLSSTGKLKLWEVERPLDLSIVLRHCRYSISVLFDSYAKWCTDQPRFYPCTSQSSMPQHSQRVCTELPDTTRVWACRYFISLLLEL